jgi:2-amino-4-hydroxy-6-hydroxymethyldihydropteridine diphosphokinase
MTLASADLSGFRSTVFVGLGSNMENPEWQVQRALREIDDIPEASLDKVSSFYRTAPVGIIDQPPFVNAVAQVTTTLSPRRFLTCLMEIEGAHGRIRQEKNGPRTLDLDILIFNEWRINEELLTTPHPRMHERAFVLAPLLEIAPDVYIPGKGPAKDFLHLDQSAGISRIDRAPDNLGAMPA